MPRALLLAGDAERESQAAMLAADVDLHADVLKVPHHGGDTSLDAFLADSPIVQRWREHASEVWTLRMVPVKSNGAWGGSNPFPAQEPPPGDGPFAVITRATIRLRKTRAFYSAVPAIDLDLAREPGLRATVGFGESPLGRGVRV